MTDADAVRGVADFLLRKPHFQFLQRYAGEVDEDGNNQNTNNNHLHSNNNNNYNHQSGNSNNANNHERTLRVQRLAKADALHFCAERVSLDTRPVFEGYEMLDD